MSQADITLPNSSGSTYRANHNAANDAIATKFSGSTAPTSPVGFQDFVDTSVSPNVHNVYDGTQFIEVDEIDASAHTVVRKVSAGGTGATTASGATTNIGALSVSNNLSDVANATTSFSNIKQIATTTTTGVVEKSTSAENTGGVATDVFPDVAGVKEMIDTFGGGGVNLLQYVSEGITPANTTLDFTADDTPPEITDGIEVQSLTITPSSTSSKIHVSCHTNVGQIGGAGQVSIAVFRDSTCIFAANRVAYQSFEHIASGIDVVDDPNTTSSVTYSIRLGRGSASGIAYWGDSYTARYGAAAHGGVFKLVEFS